MDLCAIVPLPARDAAAAFTPLAGASALARSVRAVQGPDLLDVVVATPLTEQARAELAAHGLAAAVVPAGQSRRDCLAAGLAWLAQRPVPPSHVLLGDYRRPLAPARLRDRIAAALRDGAPAVAPALVVTDSVKLIDERGTIRATVDRSALRTLQYPRGFSVRVLTDLVAGADGDTVDEADLAMRAGMPITAVEGDPDAFVVELPRDAAYVEAILDCRIS
jgi:2-C-methyl-D-erythritol 4-phosphate cytidylyltransferase